MKKFFMLMFAFAAMFMVLGFANNAHAQSIPPGPCPDYWINYNYVYPPAPPGTFSFQIVCADGRIFAPTTEFADGHYTYKSDPTCVPVKLIITYIDPAGNLITLTAPIPTPAGPVVFPTPWGALQIESKFDSNGCLEIKVSY